MWEIVLTKPVSYGLIVVATATGAIFTGAIAMITTNDIAAYSAAALAAYVSFRMSKSVLDRAEEKTITGDLRRVRKENVHLKERMESLERIVATQKDLIESMREQIHDGDA